MPICIECGYKLANLYTTYSKADDRSLGKGVRLTQCPRCKRFADKYVEHDFVVLFIDLVLIKPQVYRHLLFNRLGREDDRLDPDIIRLGVLLLLFDVYLTWARIEKATSNSATLSHLPGSGASLHGSSPNNASLLDPQGQSSAQYKPFSAFLNTQPIILQYIFFLVLCFSETAAFHLPIRTLLGLRSGGKQTSQSSQPASRTGSAAPSPNLTGKTHPSLTSEVAPDAATTNGNTTPGPVPPPQDSSRPFLPYYPHPAVVSTALLVSSFTKLFPLLLLIWSYDLPSAASAVSWAVIINNVAALEILLDCGFGTAIFLAGVGAVCRALVGWCILRAVGVDAGVAAAGVVETSDLLEVWGRVAEGIGLG